MQLTGTFVNPLSGDIPSTNWIEEDWDRDFKVMASLGFDTIILLRTASEKWMIYHSKVLEKEEKCFVPPYDYLAMFLRLCEKYGMTLFVGTYNCHRDWLTAAYDVEKEATLIQKCVDEIWDGYGTSPAFGGWYLTQEISSRISFKIVEVYQRVGRHCKHISNNLPIFISPGMDGIKAARFDYPGGIRKQLAVTPEKHKADWDWIMGEIEGAVDIVAFQDGHVDFDQLSEFLVINKELADKHGLSCWTNAESFDRDITNGHFPPIRWDKLVFKLDAAEKAGCQKAITFEFTPFMSPNSYYPQAKPLLDRYCDYCGLKRV